MSLTEEIEKIYKRLINLIAHPYVGTVLNQPEIDREKILIYYLLFREGRAVEQAEDCVLSLMAAELGLETHELMTINKETVREPLRKGQLITLSGDYYSALYYFLLARGNEMKLARWVAQSIQNYNRLKCALFYPEHPLENQELFKLLGNLESQLVSDLTEKMDRKSWNSLLIPFFFAKKLYKEYQSLGKSFLGCYLAEQLSCSSIQLGRLFQLQMEKAGEQFNRVVECCQRERQGALLPLTEYFTKQMDRFRLGIVGEGQSE